MGYDTFYIVTITAETAERRQEIALAIVKCAWLPYRDRTLEKGEFEDPILSFQNRGWRSFELMDLGGTWYDRGLRDPTSAFPGCGSIRGISLKEGETILLYGRGDDDTDVYRIFATSTSIIRQVADVEFVNRELVCPNVDYEDGQNIDECGGCQSCATTTAHFPPILLDVENKEF